MKKTFIVAIVMSLLLAMFPIGLALAATTADVEVTATPGFVSITNSPSTFDFGVITQGSVTNTTDGEFTITNASTVAMDIFIQCNGWSGGATPWTYGAPAADTGNLTSSNGTGLHDIPVLDGSDTLLHNAVAVASNPTWELQLNAPTSFSFVDPQSSNVTITATVD
jgi:hypothetical protein